MKEYIKPPWDEDQTPLYHLVQMIFTVIYLIPGISLFFLLFYYLAPHTDSERFLIRAPAKIIPYIALPIAAALLYKGKQHANLLMTRKTKKAQPEHGTDAERRTD